LLVDHALILIIISKDPGGRSAVDDWTAAAAQEASNTTSLNSLR
jgi:hypothetical protein